MYKEYLLGRFCHYYGCWRFLLYVPAYFYSLLESPSYFFENRLCKITVLWFLCISKNLTFG